MIETTENQAAGARCAPPPCSAFEEVSDKWDKEEGGERHIRRLSERFWVSVLHRMTGFGDWEWETAIIIVRDDSDPKKYARGKWDDRECLIVRGDYREALADKSECEILEWYAEHSGERNSMETLLAAMSENAEQKTDDSRWLHRFGSCCADYDDECETMTLENAQWCHDGCKNQWNPNGFGKPAGICPIMAKHN